MTLYNLTDEVIMAAEALECALEWEPDTDADGKPIDGDGNIIGDVEGYRAALEKHLGRVIGDMEQMSRLAPELFDMGRES